MKEAYCSFETAKLLKEKGFDESTSMVYMSCGELCKLDRYESIRNSNYNNITKNYFEYTAPTHQMAMEWLREKGLFVNIEYKKPLYEWEIINMNDSPFSYNEGVSSDVYNRYEEAVEAALKYCLENLI